MDYKRLEKTLKQVIKRNGRPRKFENPEEIVTLATEYFKEVNKDTTWSQQNWVGKDGREETKRVRTPYTKDGLATYLGITVSTWADLRDKPKNISQEEYRQKAITHLNSIAANNLIEKTKNETDPLKKVTKRNIHFPTNQELLNKEIEVICTEKNIRGKAEELAQKDKKFSAVFVILEQVIRDQQTLGAMTFHYNGNLVSRLNGYTDRQDVTSGGKEIKRLTSVQVELPEGMKLEQYIEDAEIIEDSPLEVIKDKKVS